MSDTKAEGRFDRREKRRHIRAMNDALAACGFGFGKLGRLWEGHDAKSFGDLRRELQPSKDRHFRSKMHVQTNPEIIKVRGPCWIH